MKARKEKKRIIQVLLRVIILTSLLLLLPIQGLTEVLAQKASADKISILPRHKGEDFVCYLFVKPKEAMNVNLSFLSEYQLQKDLTVKYDLILPEVITDYFQKQGSGLRMSVYVNTFLEDGKKEENTIPVNYLIQLEKNKLLLICEEDGTKQELKKIDNYFKAVINYTPGSVTQQGKTVQKISINNHIEVLNSDYDKTIYFDNINIVSGNHQLISYDFNRRFGKRGEENMVAGLSYESGWGTSQMLWGQLKKVGEEDQSNVIRTGVVFDGTSNEANSLKFMKDFLKYEMHNKGNDWRNFTSLTIAFSDDFTLPREVFIGGDIIIPKAAFEGFLKDKSHIDIGMSLVCDDTEKDSPSANAYIKKYGKDEICVCQEGGKLFRVGKSSENDSVIIKEYKDSYLIRLKGIVKCDKKNARKLWIKTKISAELCKYNGYFYFDNLYVANGKKDIIRYNVDTGIYPDNLCELYSPGTNGFYNFIFDKTLGYYHVGFDTIRLP